MAGHDGGPEYGIPSGFRFYTGDVAHRHRIGRVGAGFRLGHLGHAGHLPCLAERAGRFVRCDLGDVARQHRAHGVGFLSAVAAVGHCRKGSGSSPVFITGGNPVTSERK